MPEIIVTTLFTLMVAPDATDFALETQADTFNVYFTLEACEIDRKIIQVKNPSFHFWCEE